MTTMTFRDAVQQTLDEEMDRDSDVVLIGEDISKGVFRGTAGLVDKYGEDRVRDTPISESAIVGAAIGSSATGLRPVAEIMYSDFMGLGFEQLQNQAGQMRYMFGGKIKLPLTIRTTEGAGQQTAAQHSKTVHHLYASLPGIKVVCPTLPLEAKGLLRAAIRSDDPVICFENKTLYTREGEVPDDEDFVLPLGQSRVLEEGNDVTVVATHSMLYRVLEAAKRVEADLEIINPCSLYPLDVETIFESVRKNRRIIVADESPLSYGTHAEIVSRVVENEFFELDAPPRRLGLADVPIPFSPDLEEELLPGVDDVVDVIHELT